MFARVTFESMAGFRYSSFRKHCRLHRLESTDTECRDHWHARLHLRARNVGGSSIMDVYNPKVIWDLQNGLHQNFSLGQNWFLTVGPDRLTPQQTVESGWQKEARDVYPKFFAMMTPDNYTHNFYTKEFAAQPGSPFVLGQTLYPGHRYRISWSLDNDGWRLEVGVGNKTYIVGHYRLALFRGGRMTIGADQARFGGETSCLKYIRNGRPIDTIFPAMGSGISPTSAGVNLSEVASHDDVRLDIRGLQAPAYEEVEKNYGLHWEHVNGKTTIYYGGPIGRY
jgi:hypothetical protein